MSLNAELVRFPGIGVFLEAPDPELSPEALVPFESQAVEFSEFADPLVDSINQLLGESDGEIPSGIQGYLGSETGYVDPGSKTFRFNFVKDDITYEGEALRTWARETPEVAERWLARRATALLDGVGVENLAQLVAVDRERGYIIKKSVPGKDVTELSLAEKLRIKSEHIEVLGHTIGAMRDKGLSIGTVHDIRYSRQAGFYINDYIHPTSRFPNDIDTNVSSFLNFALADWDKLENYSIGRSLGAPRSSLPKPETTGLQNLVRARVLGRAARLPVIDGPFVNYHDGPKPLPPYQPSPELLDVVKLSESAAPAGAAKYVRGSVHVVRRANGDEGYQVVNEMNDGVSVAALEVVLGHAYLLLVDQMRYPHTRPGDENLNIEQAARLRRAGRWSRELISGGVETSDLDLTAAAAREAREEAGVFGLTPEDLERIYPPLLSSISINHQPFNLFAARIGSGMWVPEAVQPDVEEGDLRVNAYRLDTAVQEMISRGVIAELSAVTAIGGLYRTRWQKYL
jgi:hypothetical protein